MRGVSVLSVPLSNGIFFIAFYTIILFEDSNKSLISEKPKEVLNMFSEALRILDRNTAELMVDRMKDEMDALQVQKEKLTEHNKGLQAEVNALKVLSDEKEAEIARLKKLLEERK